MPTNQLNHDSIIPAVAVGKINHYIGIPVFTYNGIIWKGASEIVVQYNYTTTKNFILRSLPVKPTNVNYVPCIRFRVGGMVYRYKLWGDIGEIMPTVSLYNGEVIKRNCVIEIWNIEGSLVVSNAAEFKITTSIRSIPADYSAIANKEDTDASAAVQPLSLVNAMPTTPPSTGLAFWYRADEVTFSSGAAVDTVEDLSGNGKTMTTVSASNPQQVTGFGNSSPFGREYLNIVATSRYIGYTGSVAIACKHQFILVNQQSWSANRIIFQGGGIIVRQNGSANQFTMTSGVTVVTCDADLDVDYIVECKLQYDGADYELIFNLYDLRGDLKYSAALGTIVGAPSTAADVFVGTSTGSSAVVQWAEIIGYLNELSADDKKSVIDYIVNRYNDNAILLPNAWTDGSAWLDNE